MKLGLYYRTSTNHQDFDSQESAIKTWMKQNLKAKPESVLVYQDKMSGTKDDRPGLDDLLKDCAEGKVDTVLVYKLDRLSRRANFAMQTILKLSEANISFVSVTQPMLDFRPSNPCRNTMLGAFADFAELERIQIVERVNAGIKAAKERGVKFGRPAKFDDEGIKKIHELKAKGWKHRDIAKELGTTESQISKTICRERRRR